MRIPEAVAAEYRAPRRRVSDAPWTVKAFAIVYTVGLVAWVLLAGRFTPPTWLFSAALNIAIVVGLLRGYRGAWFVAMFFAMLSVVGTVAILQRWFTGATDDVVSEAVSLGTFVLSTLLLIHPLTRAWVRPDASARPA